MHKYDVEIPVTIYARVSIRDVHASTYNQAIDKAIEMADQLELDNFIIGEVEYHSMEAIYHLLKENIPTPINIEE